MAHVAPTAIHFSLPRPSAGKRAIAFRPPRTHPSAQLDSTLLHSTLLQTTAFSLSTQDIFTTINQHFTVLLFFTNILRSLIFCLYESTHTYSRKSVRFVYVTINVLMSVNMHFYQLMCIVATVFRECACNGFCSLFLCTYTS